MIGMTEASRTILIAAVSIAAGMTWQGVRTAAIPVASPDRLIAELHLELLVGQGLVVGVRHHVALIALRQDGVRIHDRLPDERVVALE